MAQLLRTYLPARILNSSVAWWQSAALGSLPIGLPALKKSSEMRSPQMWKGTRLSLCLAGRS